MIVHVTCQTVRPSGNSFRITVCCDSMMHPNQLLFECSVILDVDFKETSCILKRETPAFENVE